METSKEYVLSYFFENTSLEQVHLPSATEASIKNRVDEYTKRNQRLGRVRTLVKSDQENLSVWGAAYENMIPDEGDDLSAFHLLVEQSLARHGYATSRPSTSTSMSELIPTSKDMALDDAISEITAEDWSQVDALSDPMNIEEYSVIETGML